MALTNGEHGYGLVTKTLHWLTFLVIATQFVVGYTMEAPEPEPTQYLNLDGLEDDCEAQEDCDAAEAQEERCEEGVDALEERAKEAEDNYMSEAWSDVVLSGDAFNDGLSLPELHVILGLAVLVLGGLRVLWRTNTPLPPWAEALSAGERRVESVLEKVLLALLFVVPSTGILLMFGEDDWLPIHIAAHIAFFVTVGLHISLVLKHTLIQRDRHLARML